MKKLFVFPKNDDPYRDELVCARDRINRKALVVDLEALSVDYLLDNSIDVVISNGLPKEWYYTLRGMNIVSVTLGSREEYYEYADIIIDCKGENPKRYFVGKENSICGNKDFPIETIVDLVRKLEWDSDFFGFNVAFLSCMHLTENVYKRIEKFITKENISLVEYLCNCHDNRSVRIAEKNGFNFADIRLNFAKRLTQRRSEALPEGVYFKKAAKKDIPNLKKISKDLYKDSRYVFDDRFDKDKINEFYQGWVEKGVLGKYDDECWCLFDGNNPIAFCTIRYNKENTANIGLFGLHKEYRARGLGKKLLYLVFNLLMDKDVKSLSVVTQGRNYGAQNLYQSVGFRTKTTQLWYHKWI